MTEVYLSKKIDTILDKIDFSRLGKKVAIKVHFGEAGCVTYVSPKLVKGVFDKVKSLGKEVTLVECNVLYKGSRINSTVHLKTAREHGFEEPIDILDGETGEDYIEIKGCKIGKGIEKYDSLIVLSHFKGHIEAGFGGALKNVGMGFGSRAGKLDMHSHLKPFISDKCTGCGICIKHCNANAIKIVKRQKTISATPTNIAVLDPKLCEGCAMCIAACNNEGVSIPWGARTSEELQIKIVNYCEAVLSRFPNTIFINVLENITKDCDCFGIVQKPLMQDVGILYSTDIVSIEKASLDLVNKLSDGKFGRINNINNEKQIEIAEKLGLGESKYLLFSLDG